MVFNLLFVFLLDVRTRWKYMQEQKARYGTWRVSGGEALGLNSFFDKGPQFYMVRKWMGVFLCFESKMDSLKKIQGSFSFNL